MPKKPIIIIIVVLVVLFGLLLLVGGKYSSPQRTFKIMLKAMQKGDIDGYLDTLTEKSKQMLVDSGIKDQDPESLKKGIEDYEDPDFKVIEKTENMATMKSEKENTYLIYLKEKAGWKLDLEETFKKMFEEATKNIPTGE
ncbi:MAG: hypothetical protein ABH956_00800 [Candidatus Nealsonbacteria bacterium]